MESLFVYGSLRDPMVQHRLLGRAPSSTPDLLQGYKRDMTLLPPYPVAIEDTESVLDGMVLYVTSAELVILDHYEGAVYQRIRQTLESGTLAWVYVANEPTKTV